MRTGLFCALYVMTVIFVYKKINLHSYLRHDAISRTQLTIKQEVKTNHEAI